MNVFVAALAHETNSFSPLPTTMRAFQQGILYHPGGNQQDLQTALDLPSIDLAAKRLMLVKSTRHFRACFDPIAAQTLFCDTPGALNGTLPSMPYRRLHRPIWPLCKVAGCGCEQIAGARNGY
jgi:microcystin degradation protein MlrC